MKATPNEKRQYIRIGLIGGFALLIIASFLFPKLNTHHLIIMAEDVTGLEERTPISINGLKIGAIEHMDVVGNKIAIRCSFEKGIDINEDAQFQTVRQSIFSSPHIEISGLSKSGPFLTTGDTVFTLSVSKNTISEQDSIFMEEIEPSLKSLSRTIGKALTKYGEDTLRQE